MNRLEEAGIQLPLHDSARQVCGRRIELHRSGATSIQTMAGHAHFRINAFPLREIGSQHRQCPGPSTSRYHKDSRYTETISTHDATPFPACSPSYVPALCRIGRTRKQARTACFNNRLEM